jgi:hypothetical protein
MNQGLHTTKIAQPKHFSSLYDLVLDSEEQEGKPYLWTTRPLGA